MRRKIIAFAKTVIMWLCYVTKDSKNKTVYFSSFSGQYSDSPKAISQFLHKSNPDVQQIWIVRDDFIEYVPSYIQIARPGTFAAIKAQARADVWILSGAYNKLSGIYKGAGVFYIQVWHGDRAFKQVGYGAYTAMDGGYRHSKSELPYMKDCDLFVVGSDSGELQAKDCFHYNGRILKKGMPRNDKLCNITNYKHEIERIREKLGISHDVKLILYAPTFRDSVKHEKQECLINFEEVISSLRKGTDTNWICLLRLHSLSSGLKGNWEKYCLDVTDYPDMVDLLMISDVLITDYSSCAGDYILTEKPVVLTLFDLEEYKTNSRALRVDPMKTGFIIAHNQGELNSILENIYSYDHKAISQKVANYYGISESGKSSEEVVNIIVEQINK